jgi:hypothetical protein
MDSRRYSNKKSELCLPLGGEIRLFVDMISEMPHVWTLARAFDIGPVDGLVVGSVRVELLRLQLV